MKCPAAEKLFDSYIAGALPDAARHELEGHLRSCADCRAEFAAARRLDALVAPARTVVAPDQKAKIRQAISSLRTAPAPRRRWISPRLAVGLAAAVCLASAAFVGYSHIQAGRDPSHIARTALAAANKATTLKVTSTYQQDGKRVVRTIWCDGKRTREEMNDGSVCVFKDGKTSNNPSRESWVAEMTPQEWTADLQFALSEPAIIATDRGREFGYGRRLRHLRFEYPEYCRLEYFIDESTGLPAAAIFYFRPAEGDWAKVIELVYEFNTPLPNSLFELPPGDAWHSVPKGVKAKDINAKTFELMK